MHTFPLPRLVLAAALLLAPSCGDADGDAPAADGASAEFAPVNRSGVTGTIRADHEEDEVEITVELAGLRPAGSYSVNIHAGRCAAGGPVVAALGDVTADRDGVGRLSSEVVAAELGPDAPAFVQVQDESGGAVACADLAGHGRPEQPLTDRLNPDSLAGTEEGARE